MTFSAATFSTGPQSEPEDDVPVDKCHRDPQERHRFQPHFYWLFLLPSNLDRPYEYG
jgi:hypothetical protein